MFYDYIHSYWFSYDVTSRSLYRISIYKEDIRKTEISTKAKKKYMSV